MNIQIQTFARSVRLAIKNFVVNMSEDMRYNNLDLRFRTEEESESAYNALKEIGIKCYHAGQNALNGAEVLIYASDKNKFKLKIE